MSLDKFHEAGVSPGLQSAQILPKNLSTMRRQAGYTFTILSDPNTEVIKRS